MEMKMDMQTELRTVDTALGDIPMDQAVFAVMGSSGDTKYIWDKTKPVEVEAARDLFKKLLKNNYLAFRAEGAKGDKGEQVREFDPSLERLIFSPQFVGG